MEIHDMMLEQHLNNQRKGHMASTHMKQARKQVLERLGNIPLAGWTGANITVQAKVEEWNWNANIFEIYDEVKEWNTHDQKNVLKYAYYFFNKDKMINELHSHLVGWSVDEDDE